MKAKSPWVRYMKLSIIYESSYYTTTPVIVGWKHFWWETTIYTFQGRLTAGKTCSTACSWHAEIPRKLVVLLKPFSNIDSTKLGCTVTVHTAQWLCQRIYICKYVEFGWKLGWSMLNVNCRQLIKFFFAVFLDGIDYNIFHMHLLNDRKCLSCLFPISLIYVIFHPRHSTNGEQLHYMANNY